jgi:hypothetical protein
MRIKPVRLSCQPIDSRSFMGPMGPMGPMGRGEIIAVQAPDSVIDRLKKDDDANGSNKVTTKKSKGSILSMILWLIFLAFLIWLFWRWIMSMSNSKKGKVVIAVTSTQARDNPTATAAINALKKASISIDHIQMLPATQNKSWVNVSNGSHVIYLLPLHNSAAAAAKPIVVGELSVPPGQYRSIKFHINKMMAEGADGSKLVYTPGNDIEFEAAINVVAKKDSTTVVVLDINLEDSLRDTIDENGKPVKVFAPVIRYQVNGDSQVTTSSKRLVFQKPGVVLDKGVVSMGIDGTMGKGISIPANMPLVVNKGKVMISSGPQGGQVPTSQTPERGPAPFIDFLSPAGPMGKNVKPPLMKPMGDQAGPYGKDGHGILGNMTFPPLGMQQQQQQQMRYPMDGPIVQSYPDLSEILASPQRTPAFIHGNYNRGMKQ